MAMTPTFRVPPNIFPVARLSLKIIKSLHHLENFKSKPRSVQYHVRGLTQMIQPAFSSDTFISAYIQDAAETWGMNVCKHMIDHYSSITTASAKECIGIANLSAQQFEQAFSAAVHWSKSSLGKKLKNSTIVEAHNLVFKRFPANKNNNSNKTQRQAPVRSVTLTSADNNQAEKLVITVKANHDYTMPKQKLESPSEETAVKRYVTSPASQNKTSKKTSKSRTPSKSNSIGVPTSTTTRVPTRDPTPPILPAVTSLETPNQAVTPCTCACSRTRPSTISTGSSLTAHASPAQQGKPANQLPPFDTPVNSTPISPSDTPAAMLNNIRVHKDSNTRNKTWTLSAPYNDIDTLVIGDVNVSVLECEDNVFIESFPQLRSENIINMLSNFSPCDNITTLYILVGYHESITSFRKFFNKLCKKLIDSFPKATVYYSVLPNSSTFEASVFKNIETINSIMMEKCTKNGIAFYVKPPRCTTPQFEVDMEWSREYAAIVYSNWIEFSNQKN